MTVPTEISSPIKDFFVNHKGKIIIVIISLIAGIASITYLGKDNAIEQEAEKVIEAETGIKVDLSP